MSTLEYTLVSTLKSSEKGDVQLVERGGRLYVRRYREIAPELFSRIMGVSCANIERLVERSQDENGEYVGFDLDLAQEVCDRNGWTLEKQPIDWDSKDMELDSGAIDCIWNGFTMNGREDDYTFSDPYVDNSQVIVVAEDSGIEQLSDLAGKTVGVQAASAALDLLQSEEEGGQKELADTFGALNEFADYNTAFTELQAGALDALAIDVGVAKYQLNSRGEGFKILDETLNTEQYAIGFKKGNTELCDIVNADLQKLADDGTVAELAEKYEIADMVTLKASDDASAEDSKDATDDAETDKTEEK